MISLKSQKGTAIIVALFVMSLVAIAAVSMITRLSIDIRTTELIDNATQGYLYAEGSVSWAMDQLNNDWHNKQNDKVVDQTPIRSPVNHLGSTQISSTIYDAQGRFNLNNLTDEKYQEYFSTLITLANPAINKETAKQITLNIVNWISPTASSTELDSYYEKQIPAYRAPHRLMFSVSELRLVKGITPALYAALASNVTALPEVTKINVNSAPALVLMCLSPTLTPSSAKGLIAKRHENLFATTQQFSALDLIKNNPFPQDKITTTSNYFLVKTSVKVEKQTILVYTLLQRGEKDGKSLTTIIWQSKGTL